MTPCGSSGVGTRRTRLGAPWNWRASLAEPVPIWLDPYGRPCPCRPASTTGDPLRSTGRDLWAIEVRHRLTLRARVVDGEPELVKWGDWGRAARLRFRYRHPRTGAATTIDELVRVPAWIPSSYARGRGSTTLCWDSLPSGRLRHPVLLYAIFLGFLRLAPWTGRPRETRGASS
jgi:hypothetical protein